MDWWSGLDTPVDCFDYLSKVFSWIGFTTGYGVSTVLRIELREISHVTDNLN